MKRICSVMLVLLLVMAAVMCPSAANAEDLSYEQKLEQAKQVARDIISTIPEGLTDEERIRHAAGAVSYFCQERCVYTSEDPDYGTAYGVFIKGVYTCAGSTRALGLILDLLGYEWIHMNEHQYTHQWCRLTLNGRTFFADGQIGVCGYADSPMEASMEDFLLHDYYYYYYPAEKGWIPSYLLGDADADGSITVVDATCIQRFLADFPTESYDARAADADMDEDITVMDATAIQRYLADMVTCAQIGTRFILPDAAE